MWLAGDAATIEEAVENRLQSLDGSRRKNAVLCFETVFSFSPESEPKSLSEWSKDTVDWAREFFGDENVVGFEIHLDETTTHIHLQAVPLVEKQRKVRGSGSDSPKYYAPQLKLDAHYFTGSPKKLSDMQTSYADAMAKHGLKRGQGKSGTGAHHVDVRTVRGKMNDDYEADIRKGMATEIKQHRNTQNENLHLKEKVRSAMSQSMHYSRQANVVKEEAEKLREKLAKEKAEKDLLEQQNSLLNNRLNEIDPIRQVGNVPSLLQLKPSFCK
ncbi:hypothetical protein D8Y20_13470 [Mariprofundus sp. EBB-1]|nr:hypothetical protein D8Y20_13470 [Mariprofundus sp. EBB-1]